MNKLVLHHTYANGLAFDISQNANHGFPILVEPGTAPFLASFAFKQPGSRINVRPSASLDNLYCIRAIVRFFLSPVAGWHRFNLMEGHLSYALFVNPNGSLQGTILDANSQWTGATSAPGAITLNTWHVGELRHDGVSNLQLFLDNKLIAQAQNVVGPVRSIADEGVAIGHWPGGSGVYTFEGYINDVQLWKYDPRDDLINLLDPCCIDRKALDQAYLNAKAKGWNSDTIRTKAYELLGAVAQYAAAIRGGSLTETVKQNNIGTALIAALARRSGNDYKKAFELAIGQAMANLSEQQRADLTEPIVKIVQQLPFSIDEFREFAKVLCLDFTLLDPSKLRPNPNPIGDPPTGGGGSDDGGKK
ncbi:LamG-like jellyroll fold domain-containing protein [Burkholderia ubonensis]|uniref:LamG-like jellyroll fold domain-containing protein n=1 Tax=Burkholderia ubonensis TaxID=101571 RepID=UPI000B2B3616|nr:LamG-like jellyroll fold domain-containing protein [Burkholderia ubonensis]